MGCGPSKANIEKSYSKTYGAQPGDIFHDPPSGRMYRYQRHQQQFPRVATSHHMDEYRGRGRGKLFGKNDLICEQINR
jgi:hypothetical protein